MRFVLLALLLALTPLMSGCEVIGDIFQAGFWVGVVAVVILVAAVGFVVAKLR